MKKLKQFREFEDYRLKMVDDQIRRRGISDRRVLETMEIVPRHLFVDKNERHLAYFDCPLPIDHGQTISQPYIVAFMTETLELAPNHIILEIGTGCGYQSAVLSTLVKHVISLECIEELAKSARTRLNNLGYNNISVYHSNGLLGWEAEAPYDRIIGTAAATSIPEKLISQLTPNGIMILPIGESLFDQSLFIIKKDLNGKISIKRSLDVRFVPMIG